MSDPLGKCLDEEKSSYFGGKFEHKFGAKIVFISIFVIVCEKVRREQEQ